MVFDLRIAKRHSTLANQTSIPNQICRNLKVLCLLIFGLLASACSTAKSSQFYEPTRTEVISCRKTTARKTIHIQAFANSNKLRFLEALFPDCFRFRLRHEDSQMLISRITITNRSIEIFRTEILCKGYMQARSSLEDHHIC